MTQKTKPEQLLMNTNECQISNKKETIWIKFTFDFVNNEKEYELMPVQAVAGWLRADKEHMDKLRAAQPKALCDFCRKEAVKLDCYKHATIRQEMYEEDGYKEGRAVGRVEGIAQGRADVLDALEKREKAIIRKTNDTAGKDAYSDAFIKNNEADMVLWWIAEQRQKGAKG